MDMENWHYRYLEVLFLWFLNFFTALFSRFIFWTPRLSYDRLIHSSLCRCCVLSYLSGTTLSWSLVCSFHNARGCFSFFSVSVFSFLGWKNSHRYQETLVWFEPKEICCDLAPILRLERNSEHCTNKFNTPPDDCCCRCGCAVMEKIQYPHFWKTDQSYIGREQRIDIIADYFFHVVSPDIVALHGDWLCMYQDIILDDPRFDSMYRVIHDYRRLVQKEEWFVGSFDICIDSKVPERTLMSHLQNQYSWEVIQLEQKRCQERSDTDCTYIDRTVSRFFPELVLAFPEEEDQMRRQVNRFWRYEPVSRWNLLSLWNRGIHPSIVIW